MYCIIKVNNGVYMRNESRKVYCRMYDLQKASIFKRISAYLFDMILLSIVAVLCMLILSSVLGYDGYSETVDSAYDKFGKMYEVDLRISTSEFEKLDEDAKKRTEEALVAMNSDAESRKALNMMMQLSLMIVSFGLLSGFLIMEFLIPILLKNGQTLGKKIFGVAVMHTSFIKLSGPMLFARTILGKFAVETMVPAYILIMMLFGAIGLVGPVILILLIVLQIAVMIFTNTNSAIHDLISKTVTVDLASQKIFENEKELIEWKEKMHAEKVQKQAY